MEERFRCHHHTVGSICLPNKPWLLPAVADSALHTCCCFSLFCAPPNQAISAKESDAAGSLARAFPPKHATLESCARAPQQTAGELSGAAHARSGGLQGAVLLRGPTSVSQGSRQGHLSEKTWSRLRREYVRGGQLRAESSSESGSV
jgi:hypothetical protein